MTVSITGSADNAALTVTTSISTSTTLTPASGERLVAFVTNDVAGGVEVPTVSGGGGTWEYLGNIVETGNQQLLAFENRSPTAGAAATITATWVAGVDARAIRAHRVAGSNLSIPAAIAQNWQTAPGTGTDGVTSTNVTPNTALGLILGLAICTHSSGGGLPSAGTGFTSIGAIWNFGSGTLTRDEYKTHSTSAADDATWTATGNIDHLSIALAIGEGGATISSQPTGAHVAVSATHSMSVTASASAGGGTLSYQWQVNGTNVSTGSGGTTANYTTGALTKADDGNVYRCIVTESGGTSDGQTPSDGATVNVGPIVFAQTNAAYSASAGTTVAVPYPAGLAAGDLALIYLGQKPAAANGGTATDPASSTLDASRTGANDGNTGGYTTTLGADTGNCNIFEWTIPLAGTETGNLAITVGGNGVSWGKMLVCRKPAGTTWSVAAVTGKDTAGGSVSITCDSDPGVADGDIVVSAMVIPTDVTTPSQFSAHAYSQAGVTFGTAVEYQEPDSSTGNDIGGVVFGAPVTAGTSSGAPTFTATAGGTTTNVRGPGIFTRLRAVAASTSAAPAESAMARELRYNPIYLM